MKRAALPTPGDRVHGRVSERTPDAKGVNVREGWVGWFPHSNVVHTARVEQRIGPSSQPLEGAGFDPAFIPGLTAPAKPDPAQPEEPDSPEEPEDEVPSDTEPQKPETQAEADDTEAEDAEGAEGVEGVEDAGEESTDDSSDAAPDGPVFEASDRRARIVADHAGVRLSLDEEACEFSWDEIGAVETESPRFGKRFTITVHTPDRRWYPIEIEATARSRFTEWETQLDEVLDAYFQE